LYTEYRQKNTSFDLFLEPAWLIWWHIAFDTHYLVLSRYFLPC